MELLYWMFMKGNLFPSKILGHRASIWSDSWPKVCTFFSDWSCDCGSFHFSFVVHDDTSVILEVYENSITPTERFPLPNDNGGHNLKKNILSLRFFHSRYSPYLLSQLRFTLLDCRNEHIANSSSRQSVQATTNSHDSDNIQVLST
jgi:hypothetical protein